MNWTPIVITALIPLLTIVVLYFIPVIIDWFFRVYGDRLTVIKALAEAHEATVQGIVTIVQQEAQGASATAKLQAALVKCSNDLTLAGIPVPVLTELITKAVALCKLTFKNDWDKLGSPSTQIQPEEGVQESDMVPIGNVPTPSLPVTGDGTPISTCT
jgi:hypothetical protein